MITPNTKVTALEILNELGVEDAESKFGNVRVRIGGIPGINQSDRLITIQPETEVLPVIVGTEYYELELSEGDENDNANIRTITPQAKEVLKAKGVEASQRSIEIQQVKQLAEKLRRAEDDGGEYTPTVSEEMILDKALDKLEADRAAIEASRQARENNPIKVIKVKSK